MEFFGGEQHIVISEEDCRQNQGEATAQTGAVLNGQRPQTGAIVENGQGVEMVESGAHIAGGERTESNLRQNNEETAAEIEEQQQNDGEDASAVVVKGEREQNNDGGATVMLWDEEQDPGEQNERLSGYPQDRVKRPATTTYSEQQGREVTEYLQKDGEGGLQSEAMAAGDLGHRDSIGDGTEPEDTPNKKKKSSKRSTPRRCSREGEQYFSETLLSETLHAAGRMAVSRASATYPGRTSTSSLSQQSESDTEPQPQVTRRKKKTTPARLDCRLSDQVQTESSPDEKAPRPHSLPSSGETPDPVPWKRNSRDHQETRQSPLVQHIRYHWPSQSQQTQEGSND